MYWNKIVMKLFGADTAFATAQTIQFTSRIANTPLTAIILPSYGYDRHHYSNSGLASVIFSELTPPISVVTRKEISLPFHI